MEFFFFLIHGSDKNGRPKSVRTPECPPKSLAIKLTHVYIQTRVAKTPLMFDGMWMALTKIPDHRISSPRTMEKRQRHMASTATAKRCRCLRHFSTGKVDASSSRA